MRLPFTKMHGIGNDYVYVDAFAHPVADPRAGRAPGLAAPHRHRLRRPDPDRARRTSPTAGWRCTTPTAAAARCAATASAASPSTPSSTASRRRSALAIETDAGVKTLDARRARRPRRDGHRRHGRADPRRCRDPGPRRGARRRRAADGRRRHASHHLRVDGQPALRAVRRRHRDRARCTRSGRASRPIRSFPRKVNVEFVQLLEPAPASRLRMRVWERGSGETSACGTGACAAVVAAVLTGRGAAHASRSSCSAATCRSSGARRTATSP